MKAPSPYLTTAEAAEYLKFSSVKQFYDYRYSVKLKAYRRAGRLLFKHSDLDASLYEEPGSKLRRVG